MRKNIYYKKKTKVNFKLIFVMAIISLILIVLCVNSTKAKGANIVASGLIAGNRDASTNNTKYLQMLIDDVSEDGGGRIYIPNGQYYFDAIVSGNDYQNRYKNSGEYYVIQCKDNVEICGQSETGTILCPIGTYKSGIDMFFCKEYSQSKHLMNADFRNFTIDEQYAQYSGSYDSSGKGFMIILFEDCDWENVIVKNTRGTGFGMDCPINSTVKNCSAINCGMGVTSSSSPGGSGFGIGTGYSDQESIIIENCSAEDNGKFGIFFEHQTRFEYTSSNYVAKTSKNFVVRNCTASRNMYNFGGLRANDVTFENCTSLAPESKEIYFSQNSRRVHLTNNNLSVMFSDTQNPSEYYYDAVKWARDNALTFGVSDTKFNIDESLTRAQAVLFFYALSEYPGEVVLGTNTRIKEQGTLNTGFTDIDQLFSTNNDEDSNYIAGTAAAIKWAKEQGITNGYGVGTQFAPDIACKRSDFITFLYRYAGSPSNTSGSNHFSDVNSSAYYYKPVMWAINSGIIKEQEGSLFNPDEEIKRKDAITMLYRYATSNVNFNITYNLNGGSASNNSSYQAGSSTFTLNNPTRQGYTFVGWTGSNGNTPSKYVSISTIDRGHKVYTANWIPRYIVTFNGNGGIVSQDSIIVDDGSSIVSFPNATRQGYTLEGWYAHPTNNVQGENGTILDSKYTTDFRVHNNLTLYAHWKQNEDSGGGGGTVTPETEVTYKVIHEQMELDGITYKIVETENLKGKSNSTITPPVRNYKGFTSPTPETITIASDGTTIVTYKYTRNKYKFTLGSCEGVSTNGSSTTGDYYYGATITLKSIVLDGYSWNKWDNNDVKQNTSFIMPDAEVTINPVATKIVYKITYDTKGGTITGEKTTYTVTDDTFTLVNPTMDGYTFTGWTGSNGTIPQISVTITKGSIGNKSYTANWKENVIVKEKKEVLIKYVDINTQNQIRDDVKVTFEQGEDYDYSQYLYNIDGYRYIESKENEDLSEVVLYYGKIIKLKINMIDSNSKKSIKDSIIIEGIEGEQYDISSIVEELENYKLNNNKNILKGKFTSAQTEINLYFTYEKDDDTDNNNTDGNTENNNTQGNTENNNTDGNTENNNTNDNTENNNIHGNTQNNNGNNSVGNDKINSEEENTEPKEIIPQTGEYTNILAIIAVLIIFSIITYKKYKNINLK